MVGLVGRTKAGASKMDKTVIVNMLSAKFISTARLLKAIVKGVEVSLRKLRFE